MSNRIRKRTKYLTVSAMLCALGVILLAFGSLLETLDITVAVLASLLCVYAVIEMGGAYPWGIWAVTALLAFLLLPQKTPVIFYTFFVGFYPILKEKLEKRKRPISVLLKLVVFHLCLGFIYLIFRIFLSGTLDSEAGAWFAALLYAMALLCFVVYDFALTRLITFYLVRLRKKFQIK